MTTAEIEHDEQLLRMLVAHWDDLSSARKASLLAELVHDHGHTTRGLARALRISERTVRHWLRRHGTPVRRRVPANRLRVSESTLEMVREIDRPGLPLARVAAQVGCSGRTVSRARVVLREESARADD